MVDRNLHCFWCNGELRGSCREENGRVHGEEERFELRSNAHISESRYGAPDLVAMLDRDHLSPDLVAMFDRDCLSNVCLASVADLAVGSRHLWQPVYTTNGGQSRRTSSDRPAPEHPRTTHAAAPHHRSPASHHSQVLYHGPSAAQPRSHSAGYRGGGRCAFLGTLCPGSYRTCTSRLRRGPLRQRCIGLGC